MKKAFYCFSLFILSGVLLVACSKVGGSDGGDDLTAIDQNDDIFPVITTLRPSANQVYVSGDSIVVEGKVTDDKKMYKGKVQIKDDAAGSVIAENFYETHFLSAINFRLAYKAIVTSSKDFTVLIEFQDHGANTASQTIKVKVNP
jgi:hypothetical protein